MLVVPTPRSAVCPHHGQGQCMHYTASGQQMSHKEKILYCFQPCKTCYHFSPKELSPRHRLGSGRQRWGGLVLTHLSQWPYVPSAVTWWEGTWVRAGCWEWGLPRSSSYSLSLHPLLGETSGETGLRDGLWGIHVLGGKDHPRCLYETPKETMPVENMCFPSQMWGSLKGKGDVF